MGKSIYDQMGNQNNNLFNTFGGFNNFQQRFLSFAEQFKQNGSSPEDVVRGLLNSGRMSQDDFNRFSSIANQLTGRKF